MHSLNRGYSVLAYVGLIGFIVCIGGCGFRMLGAFSTNVAGRNGKPL